MISQDQQSPKPADRPFPKVLPDIAGAYCLVIFTCFLLFAGKRALFDGDTLWHIKFGTLMLEGGEILSRDIYSHTVPGHPWTSHEWLAEILMAAVHNMAGLPGVVIFYHCLAALSFWILFRVAKRCGAGEWLSIFSVSLALALAMSHLLARPHIFTWVFGLLTLYILLGNDRSLFLLPLLIIPWTNLHGGFALGLVLQGIFLAGRILDEYFQTDPKPSLGQLLHNHRALFSVLILSLLATGLNPFGYRILLFPFEVSKGSFSSLISEWLAPSLQAFWYFRLYLLFLFFLLFINGPKIGWANRLLLLFMVNASLNHARHISIAGFFLTPLVIQGTLPLLEYLPGRKRGGKSRPEIETSTTSGPAATALLAILLIGLTASGCQPWMKLTQAIIPAPEKFSSGVVGYLNENQPVGRMFNHDEWGDYLIYAMDPPPRLFIDGRLDMYGEEILEDYSSIVGIEEDVDKLLEKYAIEWVLFPPSPLTRYLSASKSWCEVYFDDQVSVLVRKTPLRP